MDQLFQIKYDPVESIWSGTNPSPVHDFNCSLGRIIHNALRNYPKNICQICLADGITATNQDIFNWSVRLALNFKQRGLNHEDIICIAAHNSTYVTPAAVACFFNATPFHGVNPTLDVNTLTHILSLTKPKIVFCDAIDYEKLKSATDTWKPEFITLTGKVDGVTYVKELLSPTKLEIFYQPQPLVLGGNQTVIIMCSSGTTGLPKAVCVANHMVNTGNPFSNSEMVIYCNSGLDWSTGISNLIYSVADGCTRIIPDKPYTPEYFLQLVDKYKINGATFATRNINALVACPEATTERLSSLKMVAMGGEWISATVLQQLQNIVKSSLIFYGYGSTECGRVTVSIYNKKFSNTSGKLLPGFQACIVDEAGNNLGYNEVGELYLKHGRKWSGYYGNALETQTMQDSFGWFHTGDVGYFDEYNNLYIIDRKKDIYKCMGMQYWANEIEVVIAELDDVEDVCVVGIFDEKYGDAPAAMVIKRPGSSLTVEQIKEHVAKRLIVEFKQLYGGVYFADDLPHNANAKLLRQKVRDQIMEANLDR